MKYNICGYAAIKWRQYMSYYHKDNWYGWGFFVILINLLILLLFVRSCSSNTAWNNGICPYCGGHYKFHQAIGHQITTDYLYICDTCGNSIEVDHYMENK